MSTRKDIPDQGSHELQKLLNDDTGGRDLTHPPGGVASSFIENNLERPRTQVTETDGANGTGNGRASRGRGPRDQLAYENYQGTPEKPVEVDEILPICCHGSKPVRGPVTERDGRQKAKSFPLSPKRPRRDTIDSVADGQDNQSEVADSDEEEPTDSYWDPAETEAEIVACQPSCSPTTNTCFFRDRTALLRKKFLDLLFQIHYHNVDGMDKILDEASDYHQIELLVMKDKDGLPCLMKAIKRQSVDCIRRLLQRFGTLCWFFDRIGIDKRDALRSNDGKNLFHMGAEIANDRDIIDAIELCHLREDIADQPDDNGTTPLIVACKHRNNQMAVRLVCYKAKIDHVDDDGNSPVYLAAASGCAETLKFFLVHGSRLSKDYWSILSKRDLYKKRGTILQAIVESKNPEIFSVCFDSDQDRELLRRCLELELQWNPWFIHVICCTPLVDLVRITLNQDANLLNLIDDEGMKPLMRATAARQFEVVQLILSNQCGHKTASFARPSDDQTALMIACNNGYHEIAELIMESTIVDLSCLDIGKKDVFHYAAQHPEVLSVLLQICARREEYKNFKECLQGKDDSGYVSLHLAAAVGSHQNVTLLLENGVPYDTPSGRFARLALHYAACTNLKTVKALVEFVIQNHGVEAAKAYIDAGDSRSDTSLHIAASLGKWKTVSYLLKNGASLKLNHEKETPLHAAAGSGCTKTAKCLLKKNRSIVHQQNRVGETAAMFAAVSGHTKVLQLLLDYEARLWVDSKGQEKTRTCLDWAVENKKTETVSAILEHSTWQDAMVNSASGADGLLAEMVKTMPSVAIQVLDKCVRPDDEQTEYDFFALQTVEETKCCGRRKTIVTSMQALEAMMNYARDECLRHRLVKNFLCEKWKRRGRTWYYLYLLLYTVFLVFLTTYIGCVRSGKYSTNALGPKIAVGICYLFAALSTLLDLIQLFHRRLKYFTDLTTYMRLVMFISMFIFLPYDNKSNLQWQAGAIAIFLGWINYTWFLKRFQTYGIYVIMAKKIFWTFLKVFLPVGFFIMAFSMTFYVLLHDDEGFETIVRSFITSFAMMVGDINYRDSFLPRSSDSNFVLIMFFLVIFLALMTILLMNLLTGLAVGDTGVIMTRSMAEKRILQVKLIVILDKYLNYTGLTASVVKPLNKTSRRLTSCRTKLFRKMKKKLFPSEDELREDSDGPSSACQCANLKTQLDSMQSTLEALQESLKENKWSLAARKQGEIILKELHRKHSL